MALVVNGTANYGYDANGNMTTAQGNGNSQAAQDVGQLALKYDPYNKPFFIERNGKRSEFWYGPDDQRYFQLENGNQRTVYIDKLYEQIGSTIHKLYLGDYAVFTVDVTSAANSGINYLHKDRLGSIVSITDESGNLIANAGRSFDPFGKPREEDLADSDGITHAPMPDDIGDLNRPDITTRGFTGHEQLNNLSLTHMNGRVYDYNLGRFLGVDPIIAFPENSQSLNPYSYILNNPLSGTDPTGYKPNCADPSNCGKNRTGSTSDQCARGANCDEFLLIGNGSNGNEGNVIVVDIDALPPDQKEALNSREIDAVDVIEHPDNPEEITVVFHLGGTLERRPAANPGPIYYPGYFPQSNLAIGSWLVDNTLLGAVNTVANTANSIFNYGIDVIGATGEVAASVEGELATLSSLGPQMRVGGAFASGARYVFTSVGRLNKFGRSGVLTYDPFAIRFSQNSVNGAGSLVESMKANGWLGDAIDVVRMNDGVLTAIDNTRVLAASRARINVRVTIHNAADPLPSQFVGRFTTKKGVPSTWGDAIQLRIGKQNASFRNTYPNGSPVTGSKD